MWRTKTTNMMIQDSSDFTATLPQLDWWRNTAVQRILYGDSCRGMGANWAHIIFEGKLESQIHQIRLLDSGLDYTFLKIRNCKKKYSPLYKNDSMLERSNRYINSNCPNGLPSPALLLAAVAWPLTHLSTALPTALYRWKRTFAKFEVVLSRRL